MQIFKQKDVLNRYLKNSISKDFFIGFVPTMGALHQGHMSLVKKSIEENDLTIVSIFVNPTQFDNKNDLEHYPVTIESDLFFLEQINCDIVFIPNESEMYGDKKTSESFDFGGIEKEMEGLFRSDHFNGVGTIVKKLFQIINPNRAYFGEKDFQQLQIIKKLVEIEKLNVKVIGCPIARENNGLAMSSRNERLHNNDREEAGFIFSTLTQVRKDFHEKSLIEINSWVKEKFDKHPILSLEYFTIADENTLKTITDKSRSKNPRAFIAVHMNSVRLIDNLSLSY